MLGPEEIRAYQVHVITERKLAPSSLVIAVSVLSLTTGPVLGAFLVGVLTQRVGAAAMIGGMAVGAVVLVAAWWNVAVG